MHTQYTAESQSQENDVILAYDQERTLPMPEDAFSILASAFDLSTSEWLVIFNAHVGAPSLSRTPFFKKTVESQIDSLASGIIEDDSWWDDDSRAANEALGWRVVMMPDLLRLAVIEVIERFWTRQHGEGSYEEALQNLGVLACETTDDRMHALANRERLDRLLSRV